MRQNLKKKPIHRSTDPPIHRKQRMHVVWSGRVQGIGFRFTAESVALELHLTGWVRNLPDGRVEAICEGESPPLKLYLERVKTGPMQRYIQAVQVDWEEATGEFDDFQIRFY